MIPPLLLTVYVHLNEDDQDLPEHVVQCHWSPMTTCDTKMEILRAVSDEVLECAHVLGKLGREVN